jgi:biopolymer transport protein ExbD
MGMSVGGEGGEDVPMSDINTTPLVDVMLVLLIIFLITIPVAVQKVELEVPKVVHKPTIPKAENVTLSVRPSPLGECEVFWGQTKVSAEQLRDLGAKRFANEVKRLNGSKDPLDYPEVHIRGDKATPWRCVGGVVANMQWAGFFRVGFISEPEYAG